MGIHQILKILWNSKEIKIQEKGKRDLRDYSKGVDIWKKYGTVEQEWKVEHGFELMEH